MKLHISRQIFEIYSNTKFHENPSNGSVVVPCGQTQRRTDMIKLIVGFANAPKNYTFYPQNAKLSYTKLTDRVS